MTEPEAPPHDPVEWHGESNQENDPLERGIVTVWAQGWYEARELAAAALGLPVEQVDVWRAG